MTRYTPLWLQAGNYPAGVDRRLIAAVWPTAVASGCAVAASSAMSLNVGTGWIVVPTANNSGSVLCVSDAVEVVTLSTAPASGLNRIDLVCCSVASTDIGTAAGDAFTFTAVTGTAAASPVAPAVPAGSVAIAQVLVVGGSASIVSTNITDRRSTPGNAFKPYRGINDMTWGGINYPPGVTNLPSFTIPAPPAPAVLSVQMYGRFGFGGPAITCDFDILDGATSISKPGVLSGVWAPAGFFTAMSHNGMENLAAGQTPTIRGVVSPSAAGWFALAIKWEVNPL